jgi:hypothetical protein
VGGRQLEWPGTPQLCQNRVGDLLSVVVPRYGSCARTMRGCALVDPLGSHALHRPVLLSGCRGEDVLGKFSR